MQALLTKRDSLSPSFGGLSGNPLFLLKKPNQNYNYSLLYFPAALQPVFTYIFLFTGIRPFPGASLFRGYGFAGRCLYLRRRKAPACPAHGEFRNHVCFRVFFRVYKFFDSPPCALPGAKLLFSAADWRMRYGFYRLKNFL